jgi:FeS assembly SUF system protein
MNAQINKSPDKQIIKSPTQNMNKEEIRILKEKVIVVLRNIFDPEIPVNIYELGLIYETNVSEAGVVKVLMTLTSPNCPVAESMPEQVRKEISYLTGVTEVNVEITFEPPWNHDLMSDEAKLELGML